MSKGPTSIHTAEKVLEYQEKFSHIPKDYQERLVYLYKKYPFKKKNMENLLKHIDELESTSWQTITYIFYMTPAAANRPRLNPGTFIFYVPDAKNHKLMFDRFKDYHSQLNYVISTPCVLSAKVYTETPSGMSIEEKMACELELIHNMNAPDWDNIGKCYCDMVQETLITNDSIVVRGSIEKLYSCLPRVEVYISYMDKYDCRYNKRTVEKRKSFYENEKRKTEIPSIL